MTELETAIADNHAAVDEYVGAARALDAGQWTMPRQAAKWTPAQITEHLALTYEYSRAVVVGTPPGRGAPRFLQPLFRRLVVDATLEAGRFRRKSRTPKILQPSAAPPARDQGLSRLQTALTAFEAAIRSGHPEGRHTLKHPFFGPVPTVDYLRLQAIHTRHHLGQLRGGTSA
jgi:hypothetical protein